jgi:phospholipase/carboxylesterase
VSVDLLDHEVRPAAGDPQGALVLLHGRGTTEHDLFPLLDVFDPRRRLVGIAPGGPLSLPPGGRHWYSIAQLGHPPADSFMPTYERLTAWFDALPEAYGVPVERTIVGGFSQGGVMSYAVAFGAGRPAPAGILAMSCFMPTVDGLELDLTDRQGYPVAIAHGTLDQVIPLEFGRQARDRLLEAGAEVLYRESPVPHTLDPRELPTFTEWVRSTIDRSSAGAAPPPAAEGS